MDFLDYYSILGVPRFYATHAEIRSAYLAQVRHFHPDAGNVAPEIAKERTQLLNSIYDTLKDTQEKRKYDEQLAQHLKQEEERLRQEAIFREATRRKFEEATPSPPPPQQPKKARRYRGVKVAALLAVVAAVATYVLPPLANNVYQSIYYDGYSAGYDSGYSVGKAGGTSHTKNADNSQDSMPSLDFETWRDYLRGELKNTDQNSNDHPLDRAAQEEREKRAQKGQESTTTPSLPYSYLPSIQMPTATVKPAQPMPGNEEILVYPAAELLCPLAVEVTGSKNYYIYLDSLTSDAYDMAFMVSPNSYAEVEVPLGMYEIYYTTGTTWYGTEDRFGDNAPCYKCDGGFYFYEDGDYYQGYSLELYLQYDGNLDTDEIPSNQFPG